MIDQAQALAKQVVGDRDHHLANLCPFGIGFAYEVVIERVEEEMTVELVGARVALPIPLAVGALGPARLNHLPERLLLLLLDVTLARVDEVRVGAVAREPRAVEERELVVRLGQVGVGVERIRAVLERRRALFRKFRLRSATLSYSKHWCCLHA